MAKVKMQEEHLLVAGARQPVQSLCLSKWNCAFKNLLLLPPVAPSFHKLQDVGEEQEKVQLKSHFARSIISGFEISLISDSPP